MGCDHSRDIVADRVTSSDSNQKKRRSKSRLNRHASSTSRPPRMQQGTASTRRLVPNPLAVPCKEFRDVTAQQQQVVTYLGSPPQAGLTASLGTENIEASLAELPSVAAPPAATAAPPVLDFQHVGECVQVVGEMSESSACGLAQRTDNLSSLSSSAASSRLDGLKHSYDSMFNRRDLASHQGSFSSRGTN